VLILDFLWKWGKWK